MASGSQMRVGNAEREATAAELREHYASGRLTLEELNERLEAAFAATTRADLNALMTDLPSAKPFTGAGTGWNAGAGPGARQHASAGGGRRTAGSALGASVGAAFLVMALLTVGFLAVFGIGAGRPFGIVLILAGLAFLRRLLFRRRRGFGACGPRRRW